MKTASSESTPGGCTVSAQTRVRLSMAQLLNIRIWAVDASQQETDLLPRINGGLGTLNLLVEELDGHCLYLYRHQHHPDRPTHWQLQSDTGERE